MGLYNFVNYGASKAFEWLLGEGLWEELREHGVGATCFMVGSTDTPNFRLGQRYMNPAKGDESEARGIVEDQAPPISAVEAAGNLFSQLDKEWLPKVFANPVDENNMKLMREHLSRKDGIMILGEQMRKPGRIRFNVMHEALADE
jgi:short-subunit dehydrogenase